MLRRSVYVAARARADADGLTFGVRMEGDAQGGPRACRVRFENRGAQGSPALGGKTMTRGAEPPGEDAAQDQQRTSGQKPGFWVQMPAQRWDEAIPDTEFCGRRLFSAAGRERFGNDSGGHSRAGVGAHANERARGQGRKAEKKRTGKAPQRRTRKKAEQEAAAQEKAQRGEKDRRRIRRAAENHPEEAKRLRDAHAAAAVQDPWAVNGPPVDALKYAARIMSELFPCDRAALCLLIGVVAAAFSSWCLVAWIFIAVLSLCIVIGVLCFFIVVLARCRKPKTKTHTAAQVCRALKLQTTLGHGRRRFGRNLTRFAPTSRESVAPTNAAGDSFQDLAAPASIPPAPVNTTSTLAAPSDAASSSPRPMRLTRLVALASATFGGVGSESTPLRDEAERVGFTVLMYVLTSNTMPRIASLSPYTLLPFISQAYSWNRAAPRYTAIVFDLRDAGAIGIHGVKDLRHSGGAVAASFSVAGEFNAEDITHLVKVGHRIGGAGGGNRIRKRYPVHLTGVQGGLPQNGLGREFAEAVNRIKNAAAPNRAAVGRLLFNVLKDISSPIRQDIRDPSLGLYEYGNGHARGVGSGNFLGGSASPAPRVPR
eukprot:g2084.t1